MESISFGGWMVIIAALIFIYLKLKKSSAPPAPRPAPRPAPASKGSSRLGTAIIAGFLILCVVAMCQQIPEGSSSAPVVAPIDMGSVAAVGMFLGAVYLAIRAPEVFWALVKLLFVPFRILGWILYQIFDVWMKSKGR